MENEAKSSNRKLVTGLAIGALLLALVAVIIVVALVLRGRDSGEAAAPTESAKLMPVDTFMFMTFNPHLDQAKNFDVMEKAWGDNPLVKKGLAELLSSMTEEGLDYKADIEPWLGNEVAFSMGANVFGALGSSIDQTFEEIEGALSGEATQLPGVGVAPQVPQFTIAVATKDKAASDGFLDKLRTAAGQDGVNWQEQEHKGIKIVYSEPESEADTGMAFATVDNFVVLTAGGLESMQAVIDSRDSTNLTDNQNYKDVLDALSADQIGYAYIDTGAFMDAMVEAARPGLADLPPELINAEQLKAFKGAGFSIGLESNGLRVDFVAAYDSDALPDDMPGTGANANKAAGRVPAGALFYLSASGLGGVIQTGLDAVMAMPDQPEDLDEQLKMMTSLLGVSVEELIEMLSGEFAIAITHESAGIAGDPSIPIGASFLLEAKDESKFQRLLNSLSTLLSLGAEAEFPKETIGGVEVTSFSDPSSGSMIAGWGVGEGFFAVGTSEGLLEAAFGAGGDKLTDAATYKAATSPLPKEKTGLWYVNVEGLLKMAEDMMSSADRESFEEARSLLTPIKAISAAAEPYLQDKGSAFGTLFIVIESE